ncbi:MAG TPA: ATP-binding protein [Phycisphaerae bacterium]|nr:ATP-binding protein [Phycisphaerae bacterium]
MANRTGHIGLDEATRIIEEVQAYQAVEGVSNKQVSAMIGYSESVWPLVRSHKYTGDTQAVLRKAREFMEQLATQLPMQAGEYVPTSIGRMVLTVCTRATRRNTIGLVVTPAGCGKTLAMREAARRGGDRAVYLAGGEAVHAKTALAWELADRLGVPIPTRGSTAVVYRGLRKRLAGLYAGGRGVPVTILVDEATAMRPDAINLLRSLHDDPTCRTPIVLADTWRLDAQLHSPRGLPGGYEQLRSRAGAQYKLAVDAEIAADDVRAVADAILATLGRTRPLPARSYQYLHRQVANRPAGGRRGGHVLRDGALRNVMQRLHAVADVCEAIGRPAAWSVAELDAVAEMVGHRPMHPDAASPFEPAATTTTTPPPAGRRAG